MYRVKVRISNGETNEFIDCKEYILDSNDYNTIFKELFDHFPEDFPMEEPGVNVEIVEVMEY